MKKSLIGLEEAGKKIDELSPRRLWLVRQV